MIVDTGSSVAAIPCAEYCTKATCGKHLNKLFKSSLSTTHKLYDCRETQCKCTDNSRCRFYQGYAEGSYYDGYVVSDSLGFGENYHEGHDGFTYTFGCVKRETHFFFS